MANIAEHNCLFPAQFILTYSHQDTPLPLEYKLSEHLHHPLNLLLN